MKIGIYSPYLDTLGGGERYMLTFAEYCVQRGWQTEVFWDKQETIEAAMKRFHLQLQGLKCNHELYKSFQAESSYIQKFDKWVKLPTYDLIFYLSDGSIPWLRGKQNWIHFQVPFRLSGTSFWTQQKLSSVQRVICNSRFTKRFIDSSFGIHAEVVYPPVSIHDVEGDNEPKEQLILSVGRFDQIMNAKRQDVLVSAFKQMVDEGLRGWRLVLAGGLQHNETPLLELRQMSMGYPIDFAVNVSYEELVSLYKKARFYWHAAGFGIDDDKEPEKVEHFGMSIVEAMAAGCIPMVYPAGGVPEVLMDKKTGYFWESEKQLVAMTMNMIHNLEKEHKTITRAQKRALKFSKEAFFTACDERFR